MILTPHALSAATWPTPTTLKGVKSRTKPIFKTTGGELAIQEQSVKFPSLSITGESRILAIGEGGRALARLVLSRQGILTGEAFHVADIVIGHLGPHLAKGDPASVSRDDHAHAILAALQKKPNILILDEALFSSDEAWAQLFDELMCGDALNSFKGAVVACVEKEPSALQLHGWSERWVKGKDGIQKETIASRFEIVEDAVGVCAREASGADAGSRKAARDAMRTGSDVEALMEEARELSEFCFEEDIVEAARADGDTVVLLCERTAEGSRSLRGYVCYRYYPAPRLELHVSRLAVSRQHRGRGLAKSLMNWLLSRAAKIPQAALRWITLGALESAVAFYGRLGFTSAEPRESPKEGSDPQTWMELPNGSAILQGAAASALTLGNAPSPVRSTVEAPNVTNAQGQRARNQSEDETAAMSTREAKDIKKRIQDVEKRLKSHRKKGSVDDEDLGRLMLELEELKGELSSK